MSQTWYFKFIASDDIVICYGCFLLSGAKQAFPILQDFPITEHSRKTRPYLLRCISGRQHFFRQIGSVMDLSFRKLLARHSVARWQTLRLVLLQYLQGRCVARIASNAATHSGARLTVNLIQNSGAAWVFFVRIGKMNHVTSAASKPNRSRVL